MTRWVGSGTLILVVAAYQLDHYHSVVALTHHGRAFGGGRGDAAGFDAHWFAHRFIPYFSSQRQM